MQKKNYHLQEIEDIIYVLDETGELLKKESINDYPVGIKRTYQSRVKIR